MPPTTQAPHAYQQVGVNVLREMATLAVKAEPHAYQQAGVNVLRNMVPFAATATPHAYQQVGVNNIPFTAGSVPLDNDDQYGRAILDLGPRAYWPLLEPSGTQFYDATGNGHVATASGTVIPGGGSLRAGITRPSVTLAGGHLYVADADRLRPETFTAGVSVVMTVLITSYPSYQGLFSKFVAPFPGQTGQGLELSLDASSPHQTIAALGGGTSGTGPQHFTGMDLALNSAYTLVWSYDHVLGTRKYWVNGTLASTASAGSVNWSTATTAGQNIFIGAADSYGGGAVNPLNGRLQDVAYFDYPLDQADVDLIWEGIGNEALSVWVGDDWLTIAKDEHTHPTSAPHVGLASPVNPATGRGWMEWTP